MTDESQMDLDFGDDVSEEQAQAAATEVEAPAEEQAPAAEGTEAAAEASDDDPARPTRKQDLIPRYRYNYASRKRKEAEARIAELEAQLESQQQPAPQQPAQPQQPSGPTEGQVYNRLAELDDHIETARSEGNRADVIKLRQEQRFLEQYLSDMAVQKRFAAAPRPQDISKDEVLQDVFAVMQTKNKVEQLEAMYPVFDPKHASFDSEATDEVMELFDVFAQKMPRPEALERAALYVAGVRGILAESTGEPTRRQTQLAKNLAASAAQPPQLSNAGYASDAAGVTKRVDVMRMSQEQFESLSDKDLDALLV